MTPHRATEVGKDRIAPEGMIWVCDACGKTARDRYGIVGEHSHGWDESCMMHAVLIEDPRTKKDPGN